MDELVEAPWLSIKLVWVPGETALRFVLGLTGDIAWTCGGRVVIGAVGNFF